jgi:nicotinic acid mononucleotide adenylyltransferase
VTYLSDIELPVSSSSIREELGQGRVPAMLPPAVFAYIKAHHLYGWQDSA